MPGFKIAARAGIWLSLQREDESGVSVVLVCWQCKRERHERFERPFIGLEFRCLILSANDALKLAVSAGFEPAQPFDWTV